MAVRHFPVWLRPCKAARPDEAGIAHDLDCQCLADVVGALVSLPGWRC